MAGDRLYSVAVVWFTVQLTGSAAAVAVVSLADTAPFLVVSLFAGAVADSRDGLGLARSVDVIRAGVVGSVPILYFIGQLHLVGLVVVAAALSSMEAFFLPSLQASLPRLVEPARMTRSSPCWTAPTGWGGCWDRASSGCWPPWSPRSISSRWTP